MSGQPQTLARTLFFPPNSAQPTFSSLKSESKAGLESSVINGLDASSVLSKLLKDSLISKLEPITDKKMFQNDNSDSHQQTAVDENLNITNIVRGDCKYYF